MADAFAHRLAGARSAPERGWIWVRGVGDIVTHAFLDRVSRRHIRGGGGPTFQSQELRWALRNLARSPILSLIAVLTLSLGIGATTATFSMVDSVLLKGMPYREPERLVVFWPETTFNTAMVSEVVGAVPALEEGTGISSWNLTLTGVGDPLEVKANRVSPVHFRVLGVSPAFGRGFELDDGLPGAPPVVILSHGFWVQAFGGDPGVIGRQIAMAGADADTRTVVGVMPPGFKPPFDAPSVWVPLTHAPSVSVYQDGTWYVNHQVARLPQGATVE